MSDSNTLLENPKICFCHNVSLNQIKAAFESGLKTFEEVQEKTKCSTGCGGCEFEVRAIIEDLSMVPLKSSIS